MIDLRSLRHLVVLARRLNFVRAAEELGITQPTLSRSIQSLEGRLKVRLFDRDRSGVQLTPQGRSLAERAARLLIDADDLEQDARRSARGESGRVRFGMAPMPARAFLSKALSERVKAAPHVVHEVVVRDVEALWAMLLAAQIEFFVSPNEPMQDLSNAEIDILGEFPLSIIVRAGHPLLSEGPAGNRYPLLRSSWRGVPLPEEIEPHILGAPNVVEDFATLASVTMNTDALWFSSVCAIEEELRAGRLKEYFRAEQHVQVSAYSLARRTLSPAASAMVACLRAQVRDLNGCAE